MPGPIQKGPSPYFSGGVRSLRKIYPSASATVTLKKGQTGQRFALDRGTGTSYTLPPPVVGLNFEFLVTVLQASGTNQIITNAAGQFLLGAVQAFSGEAVTPAVNVGPYQFAANGSSHVQFRSNGTTTGGGIGTTLRFTCISSTVWFVEGISKSPSGNMATPFSA